MPGFQPIEFDESFAPGLGFGLRHTPAGVYLFEITGLKPSREDEDAKWRWSLLIVDGPANAGATYSQTGTFKSGAQFTNSRTLTAIHGENVIAGLKKMGGLRDHESFVKTTKALESQVRGKRFGGIVGDGEPYNGRPTSNINEYFYDTEFEERRKSQPNIAQPVAVASNGTATAPASGTVAAAATSAAPSEEDMKRELEKMFGGG